MDAKPRESATIEEPHPLWDTLLGVENKSPRTIQSYFPVANQLIDFLKQNGQSTVALEVSRHREILGFLAHAPSTPGRSSGTTSRSVGEDNGHGKRRPHFGQSGTLHLTPAEAARERGVLVGLRVFQSGYMLDGLDVPPIQRDPFFGFEISEAKHF